MQKKDGSHDFSNGGNPLCVYIPICKLVNPLPERKKKVGKKDPSTIPLGEKAEHRRRIKCEERRGGRQKERGVREEGRRESEGGRERKRTGERERLIQRLGR